MSKCQNVIIIPTEKFLIPMEFPTLLYEQAKIIRISDNVQPLFLSSLQHTKYCKEVYFHLHVRDILEGMFV